jgi:hypothetical protein
VLLLLPLLAHLQRTALHSHRVFAEVLLLLLPLLAHLQRTALHSHRALAEVHAEVLLVLLLASLEHD